MSKEYVMDAVIIALESVRSDRKLTEIRNLKEYGSSTNTTVAYTTTKKIGKKETYCPICKTTTHD